MEKVNREIEEVFYKPVKKKTTISVWVSSDGREFSGVNAERDCSNWEKIIVYNKKKDSIKKVFYEDVFEGIPSEWFFPVNEEELEIVKKLIYFDSKSYYLNINDISHRDKKCRKLSPNEWIGNIIVDNGDYKGDNNIYTLDYVMNKIERFMGLFP